MNERYYNYPIGYTRADKIPKDQMPEKKYTLAYKKGWRQAAEGYATASNPYREHEDLNFSLWWRVGHRRSNHGRKT